ncbi:hypothetical protein DH2020_011332 [Rehmannia glutinosa]|uniref:Xyloglucan endotransglucosylase/hydrolase n=1 Tax=Rehmannia glutinosa TaxID=99300 RepID=A0ABR0XD40_REHGL
MVFFSNPKAPANLLSFFVITLSCFTVPSLANFHRDAEITWGDGRGQITEGGRGLSLSLDQYSGSGFQSKNEYLFGRFDMQLKLVPGNSAGTITTFFFLDFSEVSKISGFSVFRFRLRDGGAVVEEIFGLENCKLRELGLPDCEGEKGTDDFLSSQGEGHDEIDFEFLGNATGEPYTVHTNVYSQGKGDKEQQFHLWFDPTAAFHTYSIVWNPQRIIFLVDNSPIRVFNNHESNGIPFPKNQAMRVYCSLWNADDWATQGGRVKTDWTKAPFVAYYRNFKIDACAVGTSCASQSLTHELDANGRNRLRWVQQKHMVYNYCADVQRFPQGTSVECKRSRFPHILGTKEQTDLTNLFRFTN